MRRTYPALTAALACALMAPAAVAATTHRHPAALTFGSNVTAYIGNFGEPGLALSPSGHGVYVTTPGDGGAVLARSLDGGAHFTKLPTVRPTGGPEGLLKTGGSDSDVVVAANGDILTGDLQLGSPRAIVVKRSHDRGLTFTQETAIPTGVSDREWLAVDGSAGEQVYVAWHDLATGTMFVAVSHNGARSFGPPQVIYSQPITVAESAHNGSSIGQISVDRQGGVFVSYGTTRLDTTDTTFGTPPISTIHVSVSTDHGATFHDVTANPGAADANYGNFWMASAVDRSGTVFICYSGYAHTGERQHVWLQASRDRGETWTKPFKVDRTPNGNALFGWVAGGGSDTAVLAWYETPSPDKNAAGISWRVPVVQVRGLASGHPVVYRGVASDHPVHTGGICTLGIFCGVLPGSSSDRSLLDFFKVAVDPHNGQAVVAFSDNAEAPGRVTVVRQKGGPSAFAPMKTGPSR